MRFFFFFLCCLAQFVLLVLDATKDASEELSLGDFVDQYAGYFEDGCVIDQPFQTRLGEGVVRCSMAGHRCAGFGHHKVRALVDAPAARTEAGPRRYTSNADPRFQRLRGLMEDEWTPQLTALLDIARRNLPVIWDADFMLGPPGADGADGYVLGEINVGCGISDSRRGPGGDRPLRRGSSAGGG